MVRNAAVCFCLMIVVLAIYWPVTDYPFIRYDDNGYVYENERVLGGLRRENLRWALTSFSDG